MTNTYTFGDNDLAAERLVLLARAFEPSSARLLESVRPAHPPRALDLGCGPGYTTALLHRAVGARETWGLDASAKLIARARASFGAGADGGERAESGPLSFAVHDVTAAPFPVDDIDRIFARYLLTHLATPRAVLDASAAAARAGALMVLEENFALESPDPLFTEYYRRVAAMQAHHGQDTFIGERLPDLAAGTAWRVQRFERTRVVLDARVMARLHAINVRTWRQDPFAATAFDAAELDAMTAGLDAVVSGARAAPVVTCGMGQLVLVRA